MAYITDDLLPARPVTLDKQPEAVDNEPSFSALSPSPDGFLRDVKDGAVLAPRSGDDDVRPQRPTEEALARNAERVSKEQEIAQEPDTPFPGPEDAPVGSVVGDSESQQGEGRTITRFLTYSIFLLVGLWVSNVFYSLVRNVLVTQNRFEFVLALLLLLATVGVWAFIVTYAWSVFSSLPNIESVCGADYKCNTFKLMEIIRRNYLAKLPSSPAYAKQLRMSESDDLTRMLTKLKNHAYADSKSFIADFDEFQRLQDIKAVEVIKKFAKLIAIKTAASPWRILDMAAVFFNSTLMVCEISRVYNRRTSRAHAFRLIVGWTLNLYVSGEVGQVMEGTSDAVNESFKEWLGADGLGAMMQPAIPLLSKFAGKAIEGGLNAYLAYRLGKRSIAAFRYLK